MPETPLGSRDERFWFLEISLEKSLVRVSIIFVRGRGEAEIPDQAPQPFWGLDPFWRWRIGKVCG